MGSFTTTEEGRALSKTRRIVQHACAACSREFSGLKTARFCSESCRQGDYWRRHKSEINERRRRASGEDS